MAVLNTNIIELYFDNIITAYNEGNIKQAENQVMQLSSSQSSELLLFLFNNFEYLQNKNIIPFVLECIF
jgi:hypothetical protein